MTMHDIKSNLYPCAHCEGSGTCRNGEQQLSCAVCIKEVSERASHLAGGYPVMRQQLEQGAGLLRRQAHEHVLQSFR